VPNLFLQGKEKVALSGKALQPAGKTWWPAGQGYGVEVLK
jgi:hypothetical protein